MENDSGNIRYRLEENTPKIGNYYFELRKISFSRSTFSPLFFGVIKPYEEGTIIEGVFGLHPVAKILGTLFLIGCIVEFVSSSITALQEHSILYLLCNGLVFSVIGATLFIVGRYVLGRPEEQYIQSFLTQTFAEIVDYR